MTRENVDKEERKSGRLKNCSRPLTANRGCEIIWKQRQMEGLAEGRETIIHWGNAKATAQIQINPQQKYISFIELGFLWTVKHGH